jgi:hypothetical protein
MRFTCGEVRDRYRFIQNRPRTSVTALKSDAAAEKRSAKVNFGEMFGLPIFDFCNNIGAKSLGCTN